MNRKKIHIKTEESLAEWRKQVKEESLTSSQKDLAEYHYTEGTKQAKTPLQISYNGLTKILSRLDGIISVELENGCYVVKHDMKPFDFVNNQIKGNIPSSSFDGIQVTYRKVKR